MTPTKTCVPGRISSQKESRRGIPRLRMNWVLKSVTISSIRIIEIGCDQLLCEGISDCVDIIALHFTETLTEDVTAIRLVCFPLL